MICPGCGHHGLKWFTLHTGRKATVHPEPAADGNVILTGPATAMVLTVGQDAWLRSTPLFPDEFWSEHHDKPRFVLHLAVCPNPKGADARRDLKAHRRP